MRHKGTLQPTRGDPTRRCAVTMAPYTNDVISVRWHIRRRAVRDHPPRRPGSIRGHPRCTSPGQILYNFTPGEKKLSRARIKRTVMVYPGRCATRCPAFSPASINQNYGYGGRTSNYPQPARLLVHKQPAATYTKCWSNPLTLCSSYAELPLKWAKILRSCAFLNKIKQEQIIKPNNRRRRRRKAGVGTCTLKFGEKIFWQFSCKILAFFGQKSCTIRNCGNFSGKCHKNSGILIIFRTRIM